MIPVSKVVLALTASFSIALGTIAIYLFHYKRKPSIEKASSQLQPKVDAQLSCVTAFQKEKLEPNVAVAIRTFLSSSELSIRQGFLLMLHQASSFTCNYPVIRDSGCLEKMLNLLDTSRFDPPTMRQNLVILQTITNLACDQNTLSTLEEHLDTIFTIANTTDYSDQACAALQLLCNIALTPKGCRLLDEKAKELLEMLTTRDPYLLRQVLSILLNLSCDPTSSKLLMYITVPGNFVDTLVFCLSPSVPPLVSVQAVMLLKNMYNLICIRGTATENREFVPSGYTMQDFLLNTRNPIKLQLISLTSEPLTSEVTAELVQQSEELCTLLHTHFDDDGNGLIEHR